MIQLARSPAHDMTNTRRFSADTARILYNPAIWFTAITLAGICTGSTDRPDQIAAEYS